MTIKSLFKSSAIAAVLMASTAGLAHAQGCVETQFSSKNAEFYLKAETELLTNKNVAAALQALNQLRSKELNCYEEGAALRLSAAAKIESKDYNGAVRDLETALNKGYIPQSEAKTTYYNISQIYLTQSNNAKAMEYFDKWMRAGGQPTRDQKWTLAVLNQQMDRNTEALRWAEDVFRTDGPNAKDDVYKFLLYLYEKTGNLTKKAQLLEQMLQRNPQDMQIWEAIRGDYFRGKDERKAFEVHKAMYLGGLIDSEEDIMRVVNFYNTFNAPYQAAKVLEKEMNAGRLSKTYDRLELLANLYQVAREYQKAIPVIEEAARMSPNGEMYERLGRSYSELQEWAKAEEAMTQAINKGGLKDRNLAWVLIGQSRYERGDRAGAREAFRQANSRGGRGWLDFMASEDATERALVRFDAQNKVTELETEKERCKKILVATGEATGDCITVDDRLEAAEAALATLIGET